MSWNAVDHRRKVLAVAGNTTKYDRTPIFLRGVFLDDDSELPPRLTPMDLPDPESFHQRLAAWLMKQH